jgi:hypothetical protein
MKKLVWILLTGIFLSACGNAERSVELLNYSAALPPSFKFDDLNLKVMSSFINKKSGTMSILYANPLALNNAIKGNKEHPAGEVEALITWKQKADDHWFGAEIPGDLQSAELVRTIANIGGGVLVNYKKYSGKTLVGDADTMRKQERIKYIFYQQPSIMP